MKKIDVMKKIKEIFRGKPPAEESLGETPGEMKATPAEESLGETPREIKVKKSFAIRTSMLIVSSLSVLVGFVLFVLYFFSLNMVVGAPSIFLIGGGFLLFRYYWKREGGGAIEHIGDVPKEQMNSLNIYPKELKFENVNEPKGYPWDCLNDGKKYFVNIWSKEAKALIPFELPDQQYYDPRVFAERVLGLPAHKRIFERKPKLFQKLKTALLVFAIGIMWLLIMTTTGGG